MARPHFETSTRERLTGAAILVALIVLVVPELLSGPRHTARPAPAAVDEAPIRSYTLPLAEGPQGGSPAQSEALPETAVPSQATAPTATAPPPSATSVLPQAPQQAAPPRAAAQAPAAQTVKARSAEAPKARAAEVRSAHSQVAERARAAVPHVSVHTAHVTSARGWWVQVGSFGSRGNAERLARELKRKGYGTSVSESTSHGRKWYRVRVGPARDHAAAVALARRLRAAHHPGEVMPIR